METTIGFIGLGHMGAPMALNLQKKGMKLICFDAYPKTIIQGLQQTQSLAELQDCHVLISMLPSAVEVMDYSQELWPKLTRGRLVIDCSTIGPVAAKKWHAKAKEYHLLSVDAPVSGGVAAATSGSLSFMMGGEAQALHQAQNILQHMGTHLFITGGECSGQLAKICNNLILANTMLAVSEAFILADNLGLDAAQLLHVVQASSGQSWVTDKYIPVPGLGLNTPADKDYQAGFSSKMMLKDLNLALEAAAACPQSLNLSACCQQMYQKLVNEDDGLKDFSYIYDFLKHKSN